MNCWMKNASSKHLNAMVEIHAGRLCNFNRINIYNIVTPNHSQFQRNFIKMVTLRVSTRLATSIALSVAPRRAIFSSLKHKKSKFDASAAVALVKHVGIETQERIVKPVHARKARVAATPTNVNIKSHHTSLATLSSNIENPFKQFFGVQVFKIPKLIGSSHLIERFFCFDPQMLTTTAYNTDSDIVAPGWIRERDSSLQSVNNYISSLTQPQTDSYTGSQDQLQKNICNNLLLHESLKWFQHHQVSNAAESEFTLFTLDTSKFDTVRHLTSNVNFTKWKSAITKDRCTNVSLSKNPILPNMIYVANPTFNQPDLTFAIHGTSVNTYNTTAQLLFRRLHETPAKHGFNVMWLDYCCTWYGNEFCCPIQDVEYIFQHGILKTKAKTNVKTKRKTKGAKTKQNNRTDPECRQDYSVLMITLSKRVPCPRFDTSFISPTLEDYEPNQSLNLVLRDVPQLAKKYQLNAEFQTSRQYGQMLFLYFRVSDL